MRKETDRTKQKRQAIEACHDRTGRVVPSLVVAAAKNPKSVLHGEFNWNVKEAAMAHWLDRAKELIREVKLRVIIEDKTIIAPYYVSDPARDDSAYVKTIAVAKEADVAEMVLLDELKRCEVAINRARIVASVLEMSSDLERLLAAVIEIRRRVRPEPPEPPERRPSA